MPFHTLHCFLPLQAGAFIFLPVALTLAVVVLYCRLRQLHVFAIYESRARPDEFVAVVNQWILARKKVVVGGFCRNDPGLIGIW